MSLDQFEEFSKLISQWSEIYLWRTHAYVAAKTSEGIHLLSGRITFSCERPAHEGKPFRFESKHIVSERFSKPIVDGISGVLSLAGEGKMEAQDGTISLADDSGRFSDYLEQIDYPFNSTLIIRGQRKHNILTTHGFPREIDVELKAADIPFDTLNELLSYCGFSETRSSDSTSLELVAAAPSTISASSKISGKHAILECKAMAGLDREKLKIGYRLIKKDKTSTRASIEGSKLPWREHDGVFVAQFQVLTDDAPHLHAYLSYDGILLDHKLMRDSQKERNAHPAIHQIFDPDRAMLKQMLLNPGKNGGDDFESAVSTLLTLLGFSVAHYGGASKLRDGPDLIALTPSGQVAVIECTIGFPNQNHKLLKLAQRSSSVSDGFVTKAQPIIVTSRSREDVEGDINVAKTHRIAVVCKKDLEDLIDQIAAHPTSETVFEMLQKLIPFDLSDPFQGGLWH